MSLVESSQAREQWYAESAPAVATRFVVDPGRGPDAAEVQRRLVQHGPNSLPTEPTPSLWVVARGQLCSRPATWSPPMVGSRPRTRCKSGPSGVHGCGRHHGAALAGALGLVHR